MDDKKVLNALASTGLGAAVGGGAAAASGLTAVGAVGVGMGIGSSVPIVGTIVGGLVGLAVYGVISLFD